MTYRRCEACGFNNQGCPLTCQGCGRPLALFDNEKIREDMVHRERIAKITSAVMDRLRTMQQKEREKELAPEQRERFRRSLKKPWER